LQFENTKSSEIPKQEAEKLTASRRACQESSEADLLLNKAWQMGAEGSDTHFQLGASPP